MRGMEFRIERLEDDLVLGEDRQRRLRELTIRVNMARVPSVVLVECLLAALEQAVFPGEASQCPEFVDLELSRPVSKADLEAAAREIDRGATPEADNVSQTIREACDIIGGFTDGLRALGTTTDAGTPPACRYPGWDAGQFLQRWERVKAALAQEGCKQSKQ